ncbi:hypothetical protein Daus18300_001369 [Diaporthe australafricana]|uniref:LysM domain-containing protein n=1 Tax=Diaporthe australafricana TaxID=127596 RepID=A0ABR3XYJ1_9PEZI
MTASPTATLECSSQYTVQSGDTYLSVSQAQHVATHDLITANGLNYSLAEFPTSGTLCIRYQCNVAVVETGDSCRTIATANSLSQAELHSWNPFINGLCNNIGDFVGQTICLSNPLGDYLVANNTNSGGYTTPAPVPADIAPNTTTNCGLFHETQGGEDCAIIGLQFSISFADLQFLNPMLWDNCTNLWLETSYCVAPVGDITSYPGYPSASPPFTIIPQASTPITFVDPFADDNSTETGEDIIIPLAIDTRTDCWDYMWWNESLGTPMSCWDLAASADITSEMFILWNPSLDQNNITDDSSDSNSTATPTTYDYPCTISASSSYCIAVASPMPTPSATFTPPSPRGAGEIDGCTQWFKATLNCAAHLDALHMRIATFYQYNPSAGADCTGFVLSTYYCWSTSLDGSVPDDGSEPPTTTTTTTSTVPSTTIAPGGVATPTPTQDGMVAGCTAFYLVASGDGCWGVANDHGISLDDFYAWNPAVGTDCGALWPTYYVCVGVGSSPGTTTTTASATPTSSSTTTSAAATPTSKVSTDGTCAGAAGLTCAGSAFGDCCSSDGFCGSTTAYCGAVCQTSFGTCTAGSGDISEDGICGTNAKTSQPHSSRLFKK